MMDMFPFPRVTGETAEEQISSLVSYITQLKETLEFALMNISEDNLSADLMGRIKAIEEEIRKNKEDREEEVAQLANKVLNNIITEEGE
jgi:hypothetical protein